MFKLNYVKVINKFDKIQNVYLNKQKEETIKSFKQVQVNSKKFINYLIFNVLNTSNISKNLNEKGLPEPSFLIYNNKGMVQVVYTLTNPILLNKNNTNYYNLIYISLKEILNDKDNTNLFINNVNNEELYTVKKIEKSYKLEDFKHLIIKKHVLAFQKNDYSKEYNLVFNFLRIWCYNNVLKISTKGKIIIENKAFEIARKFKNEGKLENFSIEDLHIIINKVYNFIEKNKEELIKKYKRRGRYQDLVCDCKNLKEKQQISAKKSGKIKEERTQHLFNLVKNELVKNGEKTTIKKLCEKTGLCKKTVIKYNKKIIF